MSPRRAALLLIAGIFLLVGARAFTLELDPYDAYEVRASARAVAGDRSSPFAIYRSPLLVLVEAPLEGLARGSRATWVFPHAVTALAYLALALGAARLAKAAGARETTAWGAGVALALDRLAFADAPLGLPDGLGAALAAWGLALALEERFRGAGLLLGLAAATRPNDGLACLGVLAFGLADRKLLVRTLLACAAAVALFAVAGGVFFCLGGAGALKGWGELARFQHEQLAENYEKYGRDHARVLVALRSIFFMEPGTALLAPVALALARGRRALALAAAASGQLVFLTTLAGHVEARYVLPVLPPVAALVALALDRIEGDRARRLLVAGWLLLPLLLGARFEWTRARDPVLSRNASLDVAREVAAVSTSGRVYFTPDVPFPVYPRILGHEGTPFAGDPFHGIFHLGPVTIGYHLGRPVTLLVPRDERGVPLQGTGWLDGLATDPRFTADDVVIAGTSQHVSWLLPEEPPELRIYRVKPHLALVARLP